MKRAALVSILVIAYACGSEPAVNSVHSVLISDAVHNNGDPLFYFLPPLVPAPRYSGVLDRSLSPEVSVVRIDQHSGASAETIIEFTEHGRGAERVRQATDGWTIRWVTAESNLLPSESYRIIVRTGALERGFAELVVVERPEDLRAIDRTQAVAIARGEDLLIRFRIEGGSTGTSRSALTSGSSGSSAGASSASSAGSSSSSSSSRAAASDVDGDGVPGDVDNCPTVANASQLDTDHNRIGDACECENVVCTALACREQGTCDSTNGTCVDNVFLADGTACTDSNACTQEQCTSGQCRATATVSCDDGNACTLDRCAPSTGCAHEANPECHYEGRPCRADAFFAELADNAGSLTDWDNSVLLPAAEAHLNTGANASGRPWFCGPDQITCPTGQVVATVSPLLAERSTPSFRSDGHKRFYRMRFSGPGGGTLAVRPSRQCAVVAAFRAAMGAFSTDGRQAGFGRECDAGSMGIDGQPSAEMIEWHMRRMGINPGTINLGPPASGADLVEGALVDTGVIDPVANGLGMPVPEDNVVGGSGHHKHGTGMSLFLRQLAPNAALRSHRVIDQNGASTTAHIARGIDNALFAGNSTKPLVINLSLGWPPGLSEPKALYGPSCEVNEGALGESVRYALRIARMIDTSASPSTQRPVFVAAAAGNQPLPADAAMFPSSIPNLPGATVPACSGQPAIVGEQWFFPAAFNRSLSCEGLPATMATVFGVGAVDDLERPGALSIVDAESPLVAPGEHVYATFGAAPATPTTPMCTSSSPPAVTLPLVFSGSSVASALVAGAAMRAQHARVASSATPLRAEALGQLLYLTGETVCDETGTPRTTSTVPGMTVVRRLHAARLDRALSTPQCAALVTCAIATNATPLQSCASQLASCGLETLNSSGALQLSCSNSAVSVPWPANYAAPLCPALGPINEIHPLLDQTACDAVPGTCIGDAPYRTLVGTVGPLPTDPGCLDCVASFNTSTPGFTTLFLELNPVFASGTTFSRKSVRFAGPNLSAGGTYTVVYTQLDNPLTDDLWVPGASLELTVSAPNFDYSNTKITLITTITVPGSSGAVDLSPLRVVWD